MKTIKFIEDCELQSFGIEHPDNPRFTKDQVETLRNDQADRWLNRNVAELIEDLGPDELATADQDQVAQIEQAIEVRDGAEFASLADKLAESREALKTALGE